jgi:hypothetical protein
MTLIGNNGEQTDFTPLKRARVNADNEIIAILEASMNRQS